MRRTELKRHTPMKRSRKPMKRSRIKAKAPRRLKRAGSDPAYLAQVRTLPCEVSSVMCSGPIHAHHAGRKPGVALKAHDHTAIPLCAHHHDAWHGAYGWFEGWTKHHRRSWSDAAIRRTQERLLLGVVNG